ncbi:hypothetical protein BN971_03311 [Mycobacterium bohemicum DSM 44277]|uniref:Cupin n=2 Tax=Mycobacterium bohemicum TaxID=56425 RepID=A0A1X1R0S1_MYCBE|nr:hypothetical protein [Mycobacterium bohemicum]MCV6971626.1 hypothetical protein [Mycobacterium bohemicum]ORU97486.1 hypothetical protein AWB93_17735 [Mycobacterium bohemicum]CPR12018.1 hypothetical protein BN971_03311 [Mycobacterium bohemicum DSM 44277]
MCDGNDSELGVEWVDVSAEPNHVEQFRTDAARIYEVTIKAGTATLYHRHDRDTVYVITSGGRFRSQEPGHQRSRTSLGRSTGLGSQLRLLASRLTIGWLRVPAGTVILQPHKDFPLIHRVHAHPSNAGPIKMIGVELPSGHPAPSPIDGGAGLRVEKRGPRWLVYRLRLDAGGTTTFTAPAGGVLVVVAGTAELPDGPDAVAGSVHRLRPGVVTVRSSGTIPLDAVVVPG